VTGTAAWAATQSARLGIPKFNFRTQAVSAYKCITSVYSVLAKCHSDRLGEPGAGESNGPGRRTVTVGDSGRATVTVSDSDSESVTRRPERARPQPATAAGASLRQ
jgi:hypothetical protein